MAAEAIGQKSQDTHWFSIDCGCRCSIDCGYRDYREEILNLKVQSIVAAVGQDTRHFIKRHSQMLNMYPAPKLSRLVRESEAASR
ncbi:hypothetical protein AMTR_s00103p00038400 [Amborella trichopoda]|uniref:Uncharacterized protein n=1 Tax=Amborella trichopoda TaxID=13333 RepID=W1NZN1_AMBTC|nr:hypothetical protein AMTR_s00103p00038400 [Amborella trichopoda]